MSLTATRLSVILFIAALIAVPVASEAQLCQCQLPDNGSGTVTMPPACVDGYIGSMQIVTGLTFGTTILIEAKLKDFLGVVENPGGVLGGTFSTFVNATLEMKMTGTGTLAGFNRTTKITTPAFMTLSAEDVARVTLRLVRRPRRGRVIPGLLNFAVWFNRLAPGLVDWLIVRMFVRPERSV